jgi:hypothetical protein
MGLPVLERSCESCEMLLVAAAKARSNARESCGDDRVGDVLMREFHPLTLSRPEFFAMLERFTEREPSPVEWLNLASLWERDPGLGMALAAWSAVRMPTPTEAMDEMRLTRRGSAG